MSGTFTSLVAVLLLANLASADTNGSAYMNLVGELKDRNPHRTRPVLRDSDTTTLNYALTPRRVTLDDARQEMAVEAWSFMYWKDQHLRWTPAKHDGIQQVHLDPSDLWMPDLALYNRVGGDVAPTWGAAPLLVKSDGTVMWFPPSYFKVPCALDLALWPRDTHNCTVSLGSWAHYGAQLDLVLMRNTSGVVMGELHQGPQWEVLGVVGARNTQNVGGNYHIDLTIVFTVTRRASQHAAYINTSMMVATLAVLFSYYVPLALFSARLMLHVFGFLVLVLCHLVLYSTLPSSGGPAPLVVQSYTAAMMLSLLSLLCCVWLQHLYEGSTSCCSTLQRLCGSRKVVGTYNTLRNEDTSGDVATPPPAQLPDTATTTTVSTETSVSIDISPATTTTHFSGPDTVVFDATTMRPDRHSHTRLPDHIREKKLAQEALLRARTANFLAAIFFAVAFLVDYIALRVRLGS